MTRAEGPELRHKWTFYFLMAVGLWNFVGAGIFGFLINLPIVSYFEVGTLFTPNHAHAAMMGVFGMLAVALMAFVLRETVSDARWQTLERQFELLDLARQLFRGTAKLGPPVTRQLELQPRDLGLSGRRIQRHRGDDALQRSEVVGQIVGRDRHARSGSDPPRHSSANQ